MYLVQANRELRNNKNHLYFTKNSLNLDYHLAIGKVFLIRSIPKNRNSSNPDLPVFFQCDFEIKLQVEPVGLHWRLTF